MEYGQLIVELYLADQAIPLPDIPVRIYNDDNSYNQTFITDENGKTGIIELLAPNACYSLDEDYTGITYGIYHAEIFADGYTNKTIEGIQIFAGQLSYLQQEMMPDRLKELPAEIINIPSHSLVGTTSDIEVNTNDIDYDPEELVIPFVLNYPYIPNTITVHLGSPFNTSARNVTVSFVDYIKNVASSEIYPTWPDASLRANIYCQISLVMNRVYTEWYRSQGYAFDITNSTSYDQAFVYGRNIYDSVSKITDQIFNQYIRQIDTINPYYAEYCDGRIAQCNGLKQWGTVSLAQQGFNPFQILVYYYGSNIEIISTERIQNTLSSYQGFVYQRGSTGDAVAMIQRQLNRIAVNYPSIPLVYPVDGIFGSDTEAAVKKFQSIFNLTSDGKVGKASWYKLSYIYVAVTKLAELTGEGVPSFSDGEYPGVVLRQGSNGVSVQQLQYYLSVIATYTSRVPKVTIDGNFGRGTTAAVIAFQNMVGVVNDGIVGPVTWNAIYASYQDCISNSPEDYPEIVEYPGTALRLGSTGDNVRLIQQYLNIINKYYNYYPQLTTDGIFGAQTQAAVRAFQTVYGLTVDGIVGRVTWYAIMNVYKVVYTSPNAADINYRWVDDEHIITYTNRIYLP